MPSKQAYSAEAVAYRTGQFPPSAIGYDGFIADLLRAQENLARYDQYLLTVPTITPYIELLRLQEALLLKRFDHCFIGMDELLRQQADWQANVVDVAKPRADVVDALHYAQTYQSALNAIGEGFALSPIFIKALHQQLTKPHGKPATPSRYKNLQNAVCDGPRGDATYIPLAPEHVKEAVEQLCGFISSNTLPALMLAAVIHAEFFAIQPFDEGNHPLARIIASLLLQHSGSASAPLYFGHYFALEKTAYLNALRAISRDGSWGPFCQFFANAIAHQAQWQLTFAQKLNTLYQEMLPIFTEVLTRKSAATVRDFLFKNPVFRNNSFTHNAGIAPATAARFTKALVDEGLLQTIEEGSGRRPALYSFEPLVELLRL